MTALDSSNALSSSGFLSQLHVLPSAKSISSSSAFGRQTHGLDETDFSSAPTFRAPETLRSLYTMPSSHRGSTSVSKAAPPGSTVLSEDVPSSYALPTEVQGQPLAFLRSAKQGTSPQGGSVFAFPPRIQRTSAHKSLYTGTLASVDRDSEDDLQSLKAPTQASNYPAESVWTRAANKKHWTRSLRYRLAVGFVLLAGLVVALVFVVHQAPEQLKAQESADQLAISTSRKTSTTAQNATLATIQTTRLETTSPATGDPTPTNPVPSPTAAAARDAPSSTALAQVQLSPKAGTFDFSDFAATNKPFQGIAYQPRRDIGTCNSPSPLQLQKEVTLLAAITSNIRVVDSPVCDATPAEANVALVINAIKAAGLSDQLQIHMIAATGGAEFNWPMVDQYIGLAVAHQADLRAVVLSRGSLKDDEPGFPGTLLAALSSMRGNLTEKIPIGATDTASGQNNDVAREADFYLVQAAGFISSFDNPETAAAEWEGLLQAQMGNKLPDVKALFVRNLGWPASDATTAAAASSFLAGTRCGKTHRGSYQGLWWSEAFDQPSAAGDGAHFGLYTNEGESKGLDWSSCSA